MTKCCSKRVIRVLGREVGCETGSVLCQKDLKKVGTDQGGQTLAVHTIYIGKPKFPVAKITG